MSTYIIVDNSTYEEKCRIAYSKEEAQDVVVELIDHEELDETDITVYKAQEVSVIIEKTTTATIRD